MTRMIPAHIEDGRIVTEAPLPDQSEVRSVTVLVELAEPGPRSDKEEALARLIGLLKDSGDLEDDRKDYVRCLEEKYR